MLFKRKVIVYNKYRKTLVFIRKSLGNENYICNKCPLDYQKCGSYTHEWCDFINANFNINPSKSWTYVIYAGKKKKSI